MEFILLILLAVFGLAAVAGGVVGYRKSETTRGKVISAAGVGAGIAMLAIVLFVTPVSQSTSL